MSINPVAFMPVFGSTVTLSATSTSSNQNLTGVTKSMDSIRVVNTGTDTVFLKWGAGTQTATTLIDLPVPGGNTEIFQIPPDVTNIAAVCATTATVYVTVGKGT